VVIILLLDAYFDLISKIMIILCIIVDTGVFKLFDYSNIFLRLWILVCDDENENISGFGI